MKTIFDRALLEALIQEKPNAIIVYGDTNTTLAGALAAVKLHIPIIHVEAGIRQKPLTMPEEINRRLTDHSAFISAGLLCCCSQTAADNLAKEGIADCTVVTGDVMYDVFKRMQSRFTPEETAEKFGVEPDSFILVTLHRDFNVDSQETLSPLLHGIRDMADGTNKKILFPVHPRTRKMMEKFDLLSVFGDEEICSPLGYLDLMSLVSAASFVVTDSGGLQKEAFYAGKRAIVVMPDSGWREVTDSGWNVLADPDLNSLHTASQIITTSVKYPGFLYGDGNSAKLIVESIKKRFC